MWDWDDDGYYSRYDIYRDYKRGLEAEREARELREYEELDLIYHDDDLPEEGEIDLCDLICNGPEEDEE